MKSNGTIGNHEIGENPNVGPRKWAKNKEPSKELMKPEAWKAMCIKRGFVPYEWSQLELTEVKFE